MPADRASHGGQAAQANWRGSYGRDRRFSRNRTKTSSIRAESAMIKARRALACVVSDFRRPPCRLLGTIPAPSRGAWALATPLTVVVGGRARGEAGDGELEQLSTLLMSSDTKNLQSASKGNEGGHSPPSNRMSVYLLNANGGGSSTKGSKPLRRRLFARSAFHCNRRVS